MLSNAIKTLVLVVWSLVSLCVTHPNPLYLQVVYFALTQNCYTPGCNQYHVYSLQFIFSAMAVLYTVLFLPTSSNSESTWECDVSRRMWRVTKNVTCHKECDMSRRSCIGFQFPRCNCRIKITIRKEAARAWIQWWSLTPTRPPNSPLLSNSTRSIHSTTVTKDAPYSGHWILSLPTTSPSPSTSHCLYLGQPITAYHCIIAPSHHCVQV